MPLAVTISFPFRSTVDILLLVVTATAAVLFSTRHQVETTILSNTAIVLRLFISEPMYSFMRMR